MTASLHAARLERPVRNRAPVTSLDQFRTRIRKQTAQGLLYKLVHFLANFEEAIKASRQGDFTAWHAERKQIESDLRCFVKTQHSSSSEFAMLKRYVRDVLSPDLDKIDRVVNHIAWEQEARAIVMANTGGVQ